MRKHKLTCPVCTLDSKELLPAGTILDEEVLSDLASRNTQDYPKVLLLECGTVREDLKDFMQHPPYDVVFDEKEHVAALLTVMDNARAIAPILESLNYFKENDFHTYRHMLMVFALSTYFGKILLPSFEINGRGIAAGPTHDFGKINVPLEILTKKDALTKEDRIILQHHAAAGYCLLSYYLKDPDHIAAAVAFDHHERQNGSGYPRGIKSLSPFVEIVVVCDVYDALLSPRCYRKNCFDNRSAIEVITKMAEKGEIGWNIVKLLVSKNRADKPDYRKVNISLERRGHEPEENMYGKIAESRKTL